MLATIGYERAELSDFVATLTACDVEVLVDIRDRAQSRRPGFSKTALSKALADVGISYLHIRELGDPKEGREAARAGNFAKFRRIFATIMESEPGKKALSDLEALTLDNNICLMCYERDQLTCHRKIVAEHLEVTLQKKARHIGVREGAARCTTAGRMHHSYKSAASSI